MAPNEKKYWKSLEERDAAPELLDSLADEFVETPASVTSASGYSRRSFLKMSGFALAAGTLAGCKPAPLKKVIPYLVPVEEVVPGQAYWYASVCGACSAGCGVLAKNRDGRPIKLEGNATHPVSRGGLCAVGQAAVLGLYDSQRLTAPLSAGNPSSWSEVDRAIKSRLDQARDAGGAVRVLTATVNSPTLQHAIATFLEPFGDGKHVTYDPLSASAILDAHERTHGVRALPRYRFEEAEVVVGLDADFLGTWISPVEYTAGYRVRREPPHMSWHAQLESRMSITGAKADKRLAVAPEEIGAIAARLAAAVSRLAGSQSRFGSVPKTSVDEKTIDEIARRLWAARGKSLVVCGRNDVATQVLVNVINHQLAGYGATLDLRDRSFQRQGNDRDLKRLLEELNGGKVAALIIHGVNPAYDVPGMREALGKARLVVSLSERVDETSSLAGYVCPDHHYLEAWTDAEVVGGVAAIGQPAIRPLGDTRSALESFAVWSGSPQSAYDSVRRYWRENLFARQSETGDFDTFWDKALHDGHAAVASRDASAPGEFDMAAASRTPLAAVDAGELSVQVYPKVAISDGRHAHNPWLQELPDPVSKITWDNYVAISPKAAAARGIEEGDVVRVAVRKPDGTEAAIELPAQIQPGQQESVLAIALGYGRMGTDRFAKVGPQWLEARPTVVEGSTVGKNAAVFKSFAGATLTDVAYGATIAKTGGTHDLAATQMHHSLMVPENLRGAHAEPRPIVQETTLAAFLADPHAGKPHLHEGPGMWPDDHTYTGLHWGMAIDLSKCTGCSGCVVGCQAENNVPVVGKDEVRRHREMHWIRIDRYYAEQDDGIDVAFQPMMCQHCGNAPCETVCPVLATVHSSEGLNQQVYNRCVGTRYCANNCPYKVRRFNWFNYPHEDRLQNMVLNPDLTIRTRGVMEKCSFCVQRIQEAKALARKRGVPIQDGDVQPACAQSCPARAIVFGDMNDPKSAISQARNNPRHYRVLSEFNVEPSVGYLRLVRNRDDEGGGNRGHHG